MRMNVEGDREVQPAQQCQGVRRELEPKILARIEAHEQLRDPSLRAELLEEGLGAPQPTEGPQDHPFHRRPVGGKLRLVHEPSHPVAVGMGAAELPARRIAARLARSPGVLRLDAERGGDRTRIYRRMSDTKRNRELILAHRRLACRSRPWRSGAALIGTGSVTA